MDKTQQRTRLLQARSQQPAPQAQKSSLAAQQRLLDSALWKQAHQILLYMACKGETSTTLLMETGWSQSKQILLPRCRQGEAGVMDLAFVNTIHDIKPGSYGIGEPCSSACPALDVVPLHARDTHKRCCSPDLIVVPAVGFPVTGTGLALAGAIMTGFLQAPNWLTRIL